MATLAQLPRKPEPTLSIDEVLGRR
jgi:hypothetical protein